MGALPALAHRGRDPDDQRLDDLFAPDAEPGTLTVLIPSYREDLAVVRQTVLSAALQEYPDRRVVILVDDPPVPATPEHAAALAGVRALPAQFQALFTGPARRLADEEHAFTARSGRLKSLPSKALSAEAQRVKDLYEQTARWLEQQAEREGTQDHTAQLSARLTFTARADACRERAGGVATAQRTGTPDARHAPA